MKNLQKLQNFKKINSSFCQLYGGIPQLIPDQTPSASNRPSSWPRPLLCQRRPLLQASPHHRFPKRKKVFLPFRAKEAEPDKREFLDIDLNTVKERWPTALIFPEHGTKPVTFDDLLEMKRGPGTHEPNYALTEKRTDIVNI